VLNDNNAIPKPTAVRLTILCWPDYPDADLACAATGRRRRSRWPPQYLQELEIPFPSKVPSKRKRGANV
jgi:hypothetical protein